MASSVTETVQVAPMETMHMKLQNKSSTNIAPRPPNGPKTTKGKLRLDPLRALEPARKKLSTLESQRIMSVLVDSIKKSEIVTVLPYILDNLDRFRVSLGSDLIRLLEDHKVIISSFEDLKRDTTRFLDKEQAKSEDGEMYQDEELSGLVEGARSPSAASFGSQADMAMRNLQLVAQQMQSNCKKILRAFSASPSAVTAVLKDKQDRSNPAEEMIFEMKELKEIIMGMLLTTPSEESERNQYLTEVSDRERKNAVVITKLEGELKIAQDDKDCEVGVLNLLIYNH